MKKTLTVLMMFVSLTALAQEPKKVVVGGSRGEIDKTQYPDFTIAAGAKDAEIAAAIERYVSDRVAAGNFSGAVLVARGEKRLLTRAWGYRDAAKKLPNTEATQFNIGSINKVFTDVAIGQLAREGKLSLSDTIAKHLPGTTVPSADKITIEQLLQHRSGIGDFFGPNFRKNPDSYRDIASYLAAIAAQPLRFEPGTEQRYSNGGYIVLGAIIEKLTGKTYYDYIDQIVYAKLGMKSTGSFFKSEQGANRAIGYTKRGPEGPLPEWTENFATLPARGSSAGGGYSTLGDLFTFTKALRSGRLTPAGQGPFKGGAAFAGGAVGINAMVEMTADYTVIVLSNYDPPSALAVAGAITRALDPSAGAE
jgi:CubicO group peptidase (beta-lactamase class C family)